jgi:formylglycine-generating enzyme required for sulfatase activity
MPLIEAIGTADMPPPATEPQPVEPQESELAFFDKDVRWVLIGDPGNASDPQTGRGAVARDFVIAQYELTNSQYCRFLNGSATGRRAEHGTADCCEGGDENLPVCGILRLEQPDRSFRYQPKPHMADKPVTNLRWTDAARLANWLHNGATVDADTETGAYALSDGENEPDVKVAAAESARFWVPTIDEWYKAAHFMHAEGGGTLTRFDAAVSARASAADARFTFADRGAFHATLEGRLRAAQGLALPMVGLGLGLFWRARRRSALS